MVWAWHHGKSTANGEEFSTDELTAAHRTLQLPSLVRVTDLENGRSVILRVNDRGPFAKGRIIDVSKKAADLLAFRNRGTARVRVQVLAESRQMAAAAGNVGWIPVVWRSGFEPSAASTGTVSTPPTEMQPTGFQTATIPRLNRWKPKCYQRRSHRHARFIPVPGVQGAYGTKWPFLSRSSGSAIPCDANGPVYSSWGLWEPG